MTDGARLLLEYVVPLRAEHDETYDELGAYLSTILRVADVTVVDSSEERLFERHRRALPTAVNIVRTDPRGAPGRNGKVINVMAGLAASRHDHVVIADDDVRYRPSDMRAMDLLLARFDVVRPQNYFSSLPWHARWDTSRSLMNRAFGSDYPGTLGVRKSALGRTHGYRSDVLFENLELIRTVRAAGGAECRANNVFVARKPPTTRKFVSQRVRQAYDDFAQPYRLALELLTLPVLGACIAVPSAALGLLALVVAVAELGRRRAGGTTFFPASSALWAPLWVLERGVCVWAALALRARGGVPYAGKRIYSAGSSMRQLVRMHGKNFQ